MIPLHFMPTTQPLPSLASGRSLLVRSLEKMRDKMEASSQEIYNPDNNTSRANRIRIVLSLNIYRCESAKMFLFEQMQLFRHVRHVLRFGLKQSYRRVMDDVRRYDDSTARIFGASTDFYDDVTGSFLSALRLRLCDVQADLSAHILEMVLHRGRTASDGELQLCSGLLLARILFETIRDYMAREREAFLQENIDLGCTTALFPHTLERHLVQLYERLTIELFGFTPNPLRSDTVEFTPEQCERIIGLQDCLFSHELAREVMVKHNRPKD